ncbi:YqzL family protein [Alicyclobacillus kakegawensis]|uniref:YqzL family protein n=1 Tax=Alicyclobacillus kakegawensis TaxID=392012 RepID=UPI000AC8E62F|nr:YqzL family protein [Alicyclobacillus kakegawensis]
MRDFSWRYFTMTGDIEAYLLFKEEQALQAEDDGVDRRAKADVADVYATQS